MNIQGKLHNGKVSGGIEWVKTIHPDGTETQGYTWNPVGGCKHACRWDMPDGSVAQCYAEEFATKYRSPKFYAEGFDHHYFNEKALDEPYRVHTPARIFLDSMSDLMGHWVPDEQIQRVLEVVQDNPHHTFLLLTKNAPRLLQFEFPENLWVGVSMPPTQMFGKPVSENQRRSYIMRALSVLSDVRASVRWMSFEPLSYDVVSDMYAWQMHRIQTEAPSVYFPLDWAVIGAASSGRKVFQPKPHHVRRLEEALGEISPQFPVFYKGNLRGNAGITEWREEYPAIG
jgi:protein gp37